MILFILTIPKTFLHTVKCTRNEDCPLTEACIADMCQPPCDVHNPCAFNAVCVNTNHGSDCSCPEGYQGNGYVGCKPGNCRLNCFSVFIFCKCWYDVMFTYC